MDSSERMIKGLRRYKFNRLTDGLARHSHKFYDIQQYIRTLNFGKLIDKETITERIPTQITNRTDFMYKMIGYVLLDKYLSKDTCDVVPVDVSPSVSYSLENLFISPLNNGDAFSDICLANIRQSNIISCTLYCHELQLAKAEWNSDRGVYWFPDFTRKNLLIKGSITCPNYTVKIRINPEYTSDEIENVLSCMEVQIISYWFTPQCKMLINKITNPYTVINLPHSKHFLFLLYTGFPPIYLSYEEAGYVPFNNILERLRNREIGKNYI